MQLASNLKATLRQPKHAVLMRVRSRKEAGATWRANRCNAVRPLKQHRIIAESLEVRRIDCIAIGTDASSGIVRMNVEQVHDIFRGDGITIARELLSPSLLHPASAPRVPTILLLPIAVFYYDVSRLDMTYMRLGRSMRTEPLYREIANELRQDIEQGRWKKGERLPKEAALCTTYRVSRITVRQAVGILVELGYVNRIQGSGTYVTYGQLSRTQLARSSRIVPFTEEMRAAGIESHAEVRAFELQQADAELAEELELSPGDGVTYYERILFGGSKPMMFECGYMPVSRFPDLSVAALRKSKTSYIEDVQGYRIDYTYVTVKAIAGSSRHAEPLNVPVGTPLLMQTQIVFDDEDAPIEKTISIFDSDAYDAHYIKAR